MYARKVSLCLKSDATSQFMRKVEHEVIPLFRKQGGGSTNLSSFQITGKCFMSTPSGKTAKMPKNTTARSFQR